MGWGGSGPSSAFSSLVTSSSHRPMIFGHRLIGPVHSVTILPPSTPPRSWSSALRPLLPLLLPPFLRRWRLPALFRRAVLRGLHHVLRGHCRPRIGEVGGAKHGVSQVAHRAHEALFADVVDGAADRVRRRRRVRGHPLVPVVHHVQQALGRGRHVALLSAVIHSHHIHIGSHGTRGR